MIRAGAGFGLGLLAGFVLLGCSDQEGAPTSTVTADRGTSGQGDASAPESSAGSSTEVQTDSESGAADTTAATSDPENAPPDTLEGVDTDIEVDAGANESPPVTDATSYADASVEPESDAQAPTDLTESSDGVPAGTSDGGHGNDEPTGDPPTDSPLGSWLFVDTPSGYFVDIHDPARRIDDIVLSYYPERTRLPWSSGARWTARVVDDDTTQSVTAYFYDLSNGGAVTQGASVAAVRGEALGWVGDKGLVVSVWSMVDIRVALFTPEGDVFDIIPEAADHPVKVACAPDGSYCLLSEQSNRTEILSITALDVSDFQSIGEPELLGEYEANYWDLTWSPDSRWATLQVAGSEGDQMFTWRPGQAMELLPTESSAEGVAAFAPDGRGLLLGSSNLGTGDSTLLTFASSGPSMASGQVLTQGDDLTAKWAPNSAGFVRASPTGNDATLVAVNPDGELGAEFPLENFATRCDWAWLSQADFVYDPCLLEHEANYNKLLVHATIKAGALTSETIEMALPNEAQGLRLKRVSAVGDCLLVQNQFSLSIGELGPTPTMTEVESAALVGVQEYKAREDGIVLLDRGDIYWQPLDGCVTAGEPQLLGEYPVIEPSVAFVPSFSAQ